MSDDPRDVTPPDPHADRLNRARERMAADYDDPEPVRRGGMLAGGLIPQDKATRWLTWGALGLGGLLVLGIGSWSLLSHHQSGIPVIAPPPAPVRDKPANPGGMEANDLTALEEPADDGKPHVMPRPEQPDPAALAARYGVKKDGDTASSGDGAADGAAAGTGAAPADAASDGASDAGAAAGPEAPSAAAPASDKSDEEVPATPDAASAADSEPAAPAESGAAASTPVAAPATKPARAAAKPAAAVKPKPVTTVKPVQAAGAAAGKDTYGVQLAALNSEASALQEWTRIRETSPDLIGSHTPLIEKVTHDNAIFYRLRTRGFASLSEAQAFCAGMRTQGHACTPLRP
ncbi:SPOR domain-containing protein [Acetobacter sp. AN02]|uniref:SPOR domain-containing protein n=1 Tax=Acetobacter sp. AN02 TaxID=2894186 RepID=UPI0024344849|nr:SPOR domain-containing protein [Acetobacter sp. AN02]MDG6094903.1 SPOR domain-containing protein [Acetobacter sp. AN02]